MNGPSQVRTSRYAHRTWTSYKWLIRPPVGGTISMSFFGICMHSGWSPSAAYEVWWRSENVFKSYKWLCVLGRAVANPQSLRVCHGHTLQYLEIILLTFNPPWQKSNLTKFEAANIKSVEGVWLYAKCVNKVTLPTTSSYRWVSVCAYVRSQSRVPGKPMKFGEDRTMYAKFMSGFVFFGEQ